MRVLVTGGSGFIGSHVVEALTSGGDEVRVLDLRPPPVALGAGVEVMIGDVTDAATVERAVDGVDAVCHQAAKVGLGVDFGDAADYVEVNDLGTVRLLEALWRRRFEGRLVLAGSMVVYGPGSSTCPVHGVQPTPPRAPVDLDAGRFEPLCAREGCRRTMAWSPVDEDAVASPRNVYAVTKLHQEHLASVWAAETGASLVSLRYHNVYGPRMPRDTPYAGVAAIFASALASGRRPQLFEDGGQTRDFVHVTDVARANALALRADVAPGGSIACNVGSGTPRTIGELAAAMASALGRPDLTAEVTGRWRIGDVRHIVASTARARDALGFAAEVRFEDGIGSLVADLTSSA